VTRQISTIFEYLLGSIVLQSEIGSTVLQILQNHGINDKFVIIPMVLQIRKTMVLQRIELGGKGSLSHFCLFGLSVARMRKHGFAEKLH
jgi:hypothetical protein